MSLTFDKPQSGYNSPVDGQLFDDLHQRLTFHIWVMHESFDYQKEKTVNKKMEKNREERIKRLCLSTDYTYWNSFHFYHCGWKYQNNNARPYKHGFANLYLFDFCIKIEFYHLCHSLQFFFSFSTISTPRIIFIKKKKKKTPRIIF